MMILEEDINGKTARQLSHLDLERWQREDATWKRATRLLEETRALRYANAAQWRRVYAIIRERI